MVVERALVGMRTRVDVAARLWSRAPELIRSERALFALQGCFPRFDGESTLLKVVALQALDCGRAFPVARWAAHVEAELARDDLGAVASELVEALAAMPGLETGERRRALAMASRFAHYFVDADRFPVLDSWSEAELARLAPPHDGNASTYRGYAERYAQVSAALQLARARKLGPYLWLASQYRVWLRNPRRSIQHAARALFESNASELVWLAPFDDPREGYAAA